MTRRAGGDSRHPIQVIAVTGGKGGVGKTNVSVNLGIALCRLGRRVTLLDADLGLANVDVLLGLKPTHNLKNVLDGDCALSDVLVRGPQGLDIVPAASGLQDMVQLSPREHAGLIAAFSDIAHRLDVLIIDTAAGIGHGVTSFLCAAQEVLVVVCDEPTSITDAYALIKVLNQRHGIARVRVVSNMIRSDEDGRAAHVKLKNVTDRFLDVQLLHAGSIAYDDHRRRAVQTQRAVVDAYPTSRVSQDFTRLAATVDGWPIPASARGHLEFFVEQLITTGSADA